jgi:hypothetical protein
LLTTGGINQLVGEGAAGGAAAGGAAGRLQEGGCC